MPKHPATRSRSRRAAMGAALTLGSVVAVAAPAGAIATATGTQNVDALLVSTISFTATPADVSGWSLAVGSNSQTGGTMMVNSNASYSVTVTADKATLTEHTASGYPTGARTLAAAMAITASRTGGTAAVPGVPVAATTSTSALTLANGTGGGTDTYTLGFNQTVTIADRALPSGETYRVQLTYTASTTI